MPDRERWRSIAARVARGYAGAIALWFGLWLVVRDGWWWLALLSRVAPYLFLPAPVMLALALVGRRRRVIVASLAPPLIFVAIYWPYLTPQATPAGGGATLSVMTYNVLFSNTDYAAVADVILTYQPDLVALQEVQPEMMAALVDRLGAVYPYSEMSEAHPFGTTAAFSRHPILEATLLDLRADRQAVMLKVDLAGRTVTFISAHLLAYGLEWIAPLDFPEVVGLRIFEQERQAHLLLEAARQPSGPVILACDCNSKETSGAYRLLADELTNAARTIGWVTAEPSVANAQRDVDIQHIDYVFYRGAITAVEVDAIRDGGGSDHSPVLALLRVSD